MNRKRKRRQNKRKEVDRHHLTPRSRDGGNEAENLLLLKRYRHEAWHVLFDKRKKNANPKCRTLEEVIRLLQRVHKAKGRCLYAKANLPCRSTAHACAGSQESDTSKARSSASSNGKGTQASGGNSHDKRAS